MQYKVPLSGFYRIESKMYRSIPTGRYEWVKNPERIWFQFWKDKLVQREIYETVEDNSGVQIRNLTSGETIDFDRMPPHRL